MSTALAVHTLENVHAGFVLAHFETDSTQAGIHEGGCIFVTLRAENDDSPHDPLIDLLYTHKFAGEHQCKLTVNGPRLKYNIQHQRVGPLQILINDGEGQLIDLENAVVVGKIAIASPGDGIPQT
jgi:hypothetical protein